MSQHNTLNVTIHEYKKKRLMQANITVNYYPRCIFILANQKGLKIFLT